MTFIFNGEAMFQIAFALSFLALVVQRGRWHRRARIFEPGVQNPDEGVVVRWLRPVLGLPVLFVMGAWVVRPDWLAFADVPVPDPIRWAGLPVYALGLALLEWVHRTLDTNFSPYLRIRADHRLVTEGPYRRVRHPMYTAFLTVWLGGSLLAANLAVALPGLLGIALVIVTRTPREERMLLDRFGDEYRAYMARTGRLLPRV
jgi:protein-S-isoprenylcysteine O-methyltransferase Ste14